MKASYLSILFVTVAGSAAAQDLTKEITIEREIVPEVRAASRINLPATPITPTFRQKALALSERAVAARIPGMITTLDPAEGGDAVTVSPYKGYASIGYFPAANIGASAGYRFIDTDNTGLNAWMQYDGNAYKGYINPFDSEKAKFKNQTVTIGADFRQKAGRTGLLGISADFMYDHFNCPWVNTPADFNQSATRFNLSADWNGHTSPVFSYGIHAALNTFAYGSAYAPDGFTVYNPEGGVTDTPKAMHETGFDIAGNIKWQFTDIATLDIGLGFENYKPNSRTLLLWDPDNSYLDKEPPEIIINRGMYIYDGSAVNMLSFLPGVDLRGETMTARIGLKYYIYPFASSFTHHLAPDIRFTWTPSEKFAFYANLSGNSEIATLSSLYDYTRYLFPLSGYGASNVPLDADLGFVIGPFRGASIQLFGGYSYAADCLMPESFDGVNSMYWCEVKGFRFGAEAAYEYRDIAKATVRFECVPDNAGKNGYYRWRDRATAAVTAAVTVRPVKHLSVDLGYNLRASRRMSYTEVNTNPDYPSAAGHRYMDDLGDISNLSIGAHYDITEQIGVFGRVENLFQKEYYILTGIPGQRTTGLFGVTARF